VLSIFALLPMVAVAQQQETVFEGTIENGGFGGPAIQVTTVNNAAAVLFGGGGGWIINHTISIGGFGYGMINEVSAAKVNPDDTRKLDMGYGGIYLQYIHMSKSLLHVTANLLIGGGNLSYRTRNTNGEWTNSGSVNDAFFAIEPGIDAELNLFENVRLALGGSYRIVSGIDMIEYSNSNIGGLSVHFMVKFGKF
jgi:hypothetical protein